MKWCFLQSWVQTFAKTLSKDNSGPFPQNFSKGSLIFAPLSNMCVHLQNLETAVKKKNVM